MDGPAQNTHLAAASAVLLSREYLKLQGKIADIVGNTKAYLQILESWDGKAETLQSLHTVHDQIDASLAEIGIVGSLIRIRLSQLCEPTAQDSK